MWKSSRDPYWLTTKYAAIDTDGKPIPKGTRVFYYPNGKRFLTGEKAEQASRDFEAARADEAAYGGGC